MRNKADLVREAEQLGIEADFAKLGKAQIEELLAEAKDPGGDHLPQIQVNLAHDLKDYPDDQRAALLADPKWVAEEKLDGVRMKVHVTASGLRLDGRRKSDETYRYTERTENFPHLAECAALSRFEGLVLDAELMMLSESIDTGSVITAGTLTSTAAVTICAPAKARAIQERHGKAQLFVFDIVRGPGGKSMSKVPLSRRREWLERVWCDEMTQAGIHLVPQHTDKEALYQRVCAQGGEGVMLKDLSAPYAEGKRVRTLLKWKKVHTLDAIITGFVPAKQGKGFEGLVGAFRVSVVDEATGRRREIGAVQPGTLEFRRSISNDDGSLRLEWYDKVVEIRGNEWTKTFRLRHCVLLRFRPDKNPEDCTLDFGKIKAGSSKA